MKKLLLILMIGSLFGDTIEWKESLFLKGTIKDVEYFGVYHCYIYFEYLNRKSDKMVCGLITNIVDSDGNEIDVE